MLEVRLISSGSKSRAVLPSVDAPQAVDHAGVEKHGLGQGGFTGAPVGHQRDVADAFDLLAHVTSSLDWIFYRPNRGRQTLFSIRSDFKNQAQNGAGEGGRTISGAGAED